MKAWGLLLVGLLAIHLVQAEIVSTFQDDFYSGSGCTGSSFDCGTSTDGIIKTSGNVNVTITDDGTTTYICATEFYRNGSFDIKTCIIRQGFNNTICDNPINSYDPGVQDKTNWYNCTSSDMSTCAWNGLGGIPVFATPTPSVAWQYDTDTVNTTQYEFVGFTCNTTPQLTFQPLDQYLRVASNKGTVCSGNQYQSVVFDDYGTGQLSTGQSCTSGSFCDPALMMNYTITANITGQFCTPGCNDNVKNGGESDIDYGGSICGNCTTNGKAGDEFYGFSKELQENDVGILTNTNPFNVSYCPIGEEVGSASIASFGLILLIGGVIMFLLIGTVVLSLMLAVAGIVSFLKKRRKKDI